MPAVFYADACALIAFYGDGVRGLSAEGLAAMRTGAVAVSAITVWEISRKARLGKLPELPAPVALDLTAYLRGEGYRLVPLTPEVAEAANALPPHHADPMDRLLIAGALAEGATVITNDRVFAAYGVAVLW
jgi:PIN domain nuclease of toxin-antitoxin system